MELIKLIQDDQSWQFVVTQNKLLYNAGEMLSKADAKQVPIMVDWLVKPIQIPWFCLIGRVISHHFI